MAPSPPTRVIMPAASPSPSTAPSPTPSASPPPPSTNSELSRLKEILSRTENELRGIEASILKQEDDYIRQTWAEGNAVRGWDEHVRRIERRMGREGTAATNADSGGADDHRRRKMRPSDKIFSMSSATGSSPGPSDDSVDAVSGELSRKVDVNEVSGAVDATKANKVSNIANNSETVKERKGS